MSGQKQKKEKEGKQARNELPAIPDKLYFTIGEVSHLCDLKAHVLRYWEQEFSELTPSKRRGNRRYYQRKDVLLVRKIKNLLYDQGFTIEGARSQMASEGVVQSNPLHLHQLMKETILDLENILLELDIGA